MSVESAEVLSSLVMGVKIIQGGGVKVTVGKGTIGGGLLRTVR